MERSEIYEEILDELEESDNVLNNIFNTMMRKKHQDVILKEANEHDPLCVDKCLAFCNVRMKQSQHTPKEEETKQRNLYIEELSRNFDLQYKKKIVEVDLPPNYKPRREVVPTII